MEMTMIWIWQGEGLKNLFFPKYVPRWCFLPFSSLALQVCSEALHSPWCPHSARACTKLLVLKCGQANNTGHFKKIPHLSLKKTWFAHCFYMLEGITYPSIPKPPISPGQYPKHLTRGLLHTVRNLTQNDARPVGHLILCQNVSALPAKDFLKFFPHSVCVSCSWAIALIFAVLLEHLTAFEKAQAFWNEQFYWNEQTSVRQLSKTLDISVVFSRTLTLK